MDRDPERRRSETWLRRSTTLADIGEGVEIDIVAGDVGAAGGRPPLRRQRKEAA